MVRHRSWASALILSAGLVACGSNTTGPADASASGPPLTALAITSGNTLQRLSPGGTTTIQASAASGGALQFPEFPPSPAVGDGPDVAGSGSQAVYRGINRRLPGTVPGQGVRTAPQATPLAVPPVLKTFDGINHRDQRTANGGNQFSNEPPDQGLCAGNGFVMESVNSALRVYGADGTPRTPTATLNQFYGYAPNIRRTSPPSYGPNIFDPSCRYDSASGRWFHLADTLYTDPVTGAETGKNTLDLAVSTTSDPTGPWTVYRLPVQNDGADGTPDHGNCPCFGDYPHLGFDANGVYITTNEFSLVTGGYNGVNVYAIPKAQLASAAPSPAVVGFYLPESTFAFTLMPAFSAGGEFNTRSGGTESLISSLAVFDKFGASSQLLVWNLTNTASLNSATPNLSLNRQAVQVAPYAVPNAAEQKAGDYPLGQCLNDNSPDASACWRLLGFTKKPGTQEKLAAIDSGDSRVQQVMYANGKLWTTLGTAVFDAGQSRAGAAWFILDPQGASTTVVNQGVLAVPGNNVVYPALAVTNTGRGAVGVTLVGADYHPSAAYFGITTAGISPLGIAALGKGTQDGFSGYKAYGTPIRPRWGDYAAAATDGNTVWLANEYIAANCTLAQYMTAPLGSCGGTRTSLANWATRITQIQAP